LKECFETIYWLELFFETDYLTENGFKSVSDDALELLKILKATIKTVFSNLKSESVKFDFFNIYTLNL
jgi:four helix bundle protein